MAEKPSENRSATRITRRTLLRRSGAAAALIGLPTTLAACGADEEARQPVADDIEASAFPPLPPAQPPANCSVLEFFTFEEARAVVAFTARLVPGTPDDPGAREACVTTYIDQKLAGFESFATPTYVQAPFAVPVEHLPGPQEDAGETIEVSRDELARYGFQSSQTPQEAYRAGLSRLDAYSRERYGGAFADLSEDVQDEILTALEADEVTSFEDPSGADFFSMLQDDTSEGMFADPVYGGNRDLVGWALIGYPGAQRAYTPAELRTGTSRQPQGLRDLMPMNPGRLSEHAHLPLAGTRRTATEP